MAQVKVNPSLLNSQLILTVSQLFFKLSFISLAYLQCSFLYVLKLFLSFLNVLSTPSTL